MPKCPQCRAKMVKRHPKPGDTWRTFFGCRNYPRCKGSRDMAGRWLRKLARRFRMWIFPYRIRWSGGYPDCEGEMEQGGW